jgi:hypothetical protein
MRKNIRNKRNSDMLEVKLKKKESERKETAK